MSIPAAGTPSRGGTGTAHRRPGPAGAGPGASSSSELTPENDMYDPGQYVILRTGNHRTLPAAGRGGVPGLPTATCNNPGRIRAAPPRRARGETRTLPNLLATPPIRMAAGPALASASQPAVPGTSPYLGTPYD